jgi:signal transduction histidine kinase
VHRQNVDLVALCRGIVDSVRIFTEKKGIALLFHPDSESLAVSTDAEKIERMLLNLLSNAIKFSPDGGPIDVALSCDGGWASLTVRDQGIGIPLDKQELIFERFGQVDSSLSRSAEGTGIGLALVRQFAQALGGSVSVVSSLGHGSAFTLRLPALPPQSGADCAVGDGDFSQAATIEFADVFD